MRLRNWRTTAQVCFSLFLGALSMSDAIAGESAFSIPGPDGPLSGTLLLPSGVAAPPAILILPGSGPTDRDGNNPLGIQAATYAKLAQALAEQGVASLRSDKRGLFESAGAIQNPNAVTIADYVTDTAGWVEAIRAETGVGCVWLVGHSEGALIALVAAQSMESLCGLVLLAAPGRPLGDILQEQFAASLGDPALVQQSGAAIEALERGQRVDAENLHHAIRPLFADDLQGFLISLFSYDPARLIAPLDLPILIVHGQQDLQVPDGDAQRLHRSNPGSELLVIGDVNHLLKSVKIGDRQDNLESYADPDRPISGRVVEAIADFVLQGREAR